MSNSKGFDIAHNLIEIMEAADLSSPELDLCFTSLNGYYKAKMEQNRIREEIENGNFEFIIGLGGARL